SLQVTVNARVLKFLEEPENLNLYGKPTLKQQILIADGTSSTELTLWGDLVGKVTKEEDYCFQQVQTRVFMDTIMLTTTPNTKIITISPLENVVSDNNISESNEPVNQVTGTIKHIKVNKTIKCSSCSKVVPDCENKTSIITRCKACGMTQRTKDLKLSICISANVENEETQHIERLTIFENVLVDFLNNNNKTNLLQSPEDLEEYLLLLGTCVYTYKNRIMKSIELLSN
ncbi:uncharacterized protein, partial [Argopecten irradians]|uniref:uncharacterized protein n=1 Tax=Argopecten irradians TaxID=31199 RepID=UPI00371C11A2